jgi:hypothetical protein
VKYEIFILFYPCLKMLYGFFYDYFSSHQLARLFEI